MINNWEFPREKGGRNKHSKIWGGGKNKHFWTEYSRIFTLGAIYLTGENMKLTHRNSPKRNKNQQ